MRNYLSGPNSKLKVSVQPNIGLDSEARRSVIEILNTLLSDEAVLAMKTRSAQWHVYGPGFLDLQALFTNQFRQLNSISDKIAERVQTLGGYAVCSFQDFLNYTRLKEQPIDVPDITSLLAEHEASVRFLREDARRCIEEFDDTGTYALLVRFIGLHEKMAWILRSYIQAEMVIGERQPNNGQSADR